MMDTEYSGPSYDYNACYTYNELGMLQSNTACFCTNAHLSSVSSNTISVLP